MTGVSDRHGLIVNAIAFAMTPAARRHGCQLFRSAMKLRPEIGGKTIFHYPDLLLSCDPQDRDTYYSRSPCLIVEVLSESTVRIDRRKKPPACQTLPSLQSCLLVEPDVARMEPCRRSNDWQVESFEDGDISLDCLDMTLAITDIHSMYKRCRGSVSCAHGATRNMYAATARYRRTIQRRSPRAKGIP